MAGLEVNHEDVLRILGGSALAVAGWPWWFRIKEHALEPWTYKRQLRQALLHVPLMFVCGFNVKSDMSLWLKYIVIVVAFLVASILMADNMQQDADGKPLYAWSKPEHDSQRKAHSK
jgi:hypothetical protein